MIEPMN